MNIIYLLSLDSFASNKSEFFVSFLTHELNCVICRMLELLTTQKRKNHFASVTTHDLRLLSYCAGVKYDDRKGSKFEFFLSFDLPRLAVGLVVNIIAMR